MNNVITTNQTGTHLIVICDYDKHSIKLLKIVEGKWNPSRKFWVVPIVNEIWLPQRMRELAKYADLEIKPSAQKILDGIWTAK